MRWNVPLMTAALIVAVGGAVACGSVPQSDELQELESNLQDDKAQELRDFPNAARYHQEARQYRRVAEEARQDRHEERSREYARLGNLRYQTAVAIYEQFQKVEELEDVNADIDEINPKVREVTEARNELARELRELDEEIRDAVQRREEQRLARTPDDDGGFTSAGTDDGAADAELLETINEKIAEAEQLRTTALDYDADEHNETRGLFDRADSQLESAREMIEENPGTAQTAERYIDFSLQLFEQAGEQAEPIYEELAEKMRPANRISAIRELAQTNYGRQFVEDEAGGVRIVIAGLFDTGETDFGHGTDPLLDTLIDIADDYEEFTIHIDGFTQRAGGTTENLTLSQARAQKVQDRLIDAGIDSGRIDHDGHGQENIRFSDSADDNDRVEVVLRHEDR